MKRAYSLFEVKSLDASQRQFKGWATTPATDRGGDTINPMGAKFRNPLPLLHQHRHSEPIGLVNFEEPTKKGIKFSAEIPTIEEPGPLKDRVDTAWGEIRHGLVRAVSIGFRPLKYAYRDEGGIDFQEIEIFELSSVSIPALPDAVITQVKSMSGSALPLDIIRDIQTLDFGARKAGPVRLISTTHIKSDLKGAVRLIRP